MKTSINTERILNEFIELASIDAPTYFEREMADCLTEKFSEIGLSVTEDTAGQSFNGNAGNLHVIIPGTLPGDPILFSAHMDTVEPGSGKRPVVHSDGRITSSGDTVLGADDLTGVISILEALRCLKEQNLPHRDLEVLFTVAEEAYIKGSSAFDYSGCHAKTAYVVDTSGPIGRAALKEPTLLSFSVTFQGKAAHAGFAPEEGIHAIAMAAEAITQIPQGHVGDDTTVNIGTISGGAATNIVPEQTVIRGEIRSFVHERALTELENISRVCRETADRYGSSCEIQHEIHLHAYEISQEETTVKAFISACQSVGIKPFPDVSFGGSDNNSFVRHGIRGIVIAGGMHEVHSTKEYTYVEEIADCTAILLELMCRKER